MRRRLGLYGCPLHNVAQLIFGQGDDVFDIVVASEESAKAVIKVESDVTEPLSANRDMRMKRLL